MVKDSNNSLIMAVIALVVFGVIGAVILLSNGEDTTDTNASISNDGPTVSIQGSEDAQPTNTQESTEATDAKPLTTAAVAEHSSTEDCWTIVDGKVYDITAYVPRHPGGDEILRACGADGTSLFNERTTESGETVGSGTPHSSNASSQLSGFLLGDLAQ